MGDQDLSKCVICGKLENVLYIPKLKKRKCMDCIIKKIQKNWITIVHKVQSIETQLDSASQKPDTRKVVMSLHDIRWIQEFFPLQERSIQRFYDSVDKNGNYKPHLSKQNYPKYKRIRDIKKGLQLVLKNG